MKKIILTTLIILIVFFQVFPFGLYSPQVVYAQTVSPADVTDLGDEIEGLSGSTQEVDKAISAAQSVAPTQSASEASPKCPDNIFLCALKEFLEIIAIIPIAATGFFVQMTGVLLNFAVTETVLKLGAHIDNISGINSAWGTLRDLANILFIFGLLAIAISTILGLQGYGYKKLLAKLIIVALVINFSMFFTKFIIDTSNIFSYQFYKATIAPGEDGEVGIANAFTRHLGIVTIWDTKELLNTLKGINYNEAGGIALMFTYVFFVSIFFSVTAFVFVFAAVMLITRAVGLILLIILSPLAFAAMILPNTQGLANEWWKKLWQYAIFAPILMMLFWITASIIPDVAGTFGGGRGTAGLLDTFSSGQGVRSGGVIMVFNFIIIISFILASIIIANKMSILGSGKMTKIGGAIAGLALRGAKTVGITWPRRRFATLAAEVESGKEKKRRGGAWNPMHYVMKAVRPAGKAVMKIPGVGGLVRQGLQVTAATYKADVATRQSELKKYSSAQLVRRLSSATLPINRTAIAQELGEKNDFDDLGFDPAGVERARLVRRALRNAGMSTRLIDRMRPDSFTKEEIENGELEKAIAAMKPEDVTKIHEDVIRKAPQEIKEKIIDSMVNNFSAKQANAAIRRLDEIGKEYLSALKEKAGSDKLGDIENYLKKVVTQEKIDQAKASGNEKQYEKLRQQRSRLLTVADYIQKAPSQRAWGIKGPEPARKGGNQGKKGSGLTKTASSASNSDIDDDILAEGDEDQTT